MRFGVDGTALAGAKSASELLNEESAKLPIYTFCQELDDLLGGGVAVGEITELCGCPGIGKTQMCIQLCCSVQIPNAFGGHEGSAVYVDTEGSFMAERARDVAAAAADHLGAIARANPEDQAMADAMASFNTERVLDRIHLPVPRGRGVWVVPETPPSCARTGSASSSSTPSRSTSDRTSATWRSERRSCEDDEPADVAPRTRQPRCAR